MKHNYSKYFKSKKRSNSETFFYLEDSILEDPKVLASLSNLVRSIHDELFEGILPNDWIYEQVVYALEMLECLEEEDQYERAVCEIEPDCYTRDLWLWGGYTAFREYIDNEFKEGIKFETLDALMAMAQVRAMERIYSYVWDFLCKEREDDKNLLCAGED